LLNDFRFPCDKKKTVIKKTNEPGPASYLIHGTVGVISEFNRYETNPREVLEKPKN
jgi:hypothetical protein